MSRIRADQLVNRAGSGGPKFPNGVAEGFSVSGIVTATSFAGNVTGNVTGNLTGTVTGNADTATTSTTATNAQGLTGTPNITVGTITGTDATLSGNLTVNGTTTTIDTAVTAVDSLAVDGNITALGSAGIGTDSLSHNLTVRGSNDNTFTNNPSNIFVAGIDTSGSGNSGAGINFGGRYRDDNGNTTAFAVVSGIKENTTHNNWAGALTFATRSHGNAGGNQERLRITSGGTLFSYSPDDTTPNFKFRSNDTNWHGALNQSVEGGTITSFLSCGGDWDANGTTYNCTKNVAAYPSSAIAVHNQYNSSFESKFVFLKKAGGSTTTDGGVTELASISSAGVISDSIGPLRRLGQTITTPNYTLIASDAGKHVRVDSGATITVPDNVFTSGDMITIVANSSNDVPIVQGSGLNLYNASDGTTGNKTLKARTVCTILIAEGGSGAKAYIAGGGLS